MRESRSVVAWDSNREELLQRGVRELHTLFDGKYSITQLWWWVHECAELSEYIELYNQNRCILWHVHFSKDKNMEHKAIDSSKGL